MKEIGGYFELELRRGNDFPHSHARCVNSGRNALEFILRSMESLPRMVWIPYYTCDVILQPLKRLGIPYQYYSIDNNLKVKGIPNLGKDDYIVVNNYFGLLDSYIDKLVLKKTLVHHIIVDDTQAWYDRERLGIRQFYSPRKFFGVPDGGVAWTPISKEIELSPYCSYDGCSHLLKRLDTGAQSGYEDFVTNDKRLDDQPLLSMSNLTKAILSGIDYDDVRLHRRSNFEMLHSKLASTNRLSIPDLSDFSCPMIYPYWIDYPNLRHELIEAGIFVASYWPNILKGRKTETLEYNLATNLIPLPIDQRYQEQDMERIIDIIIKHDTN